MVDFLILLLIFVSGGFVGLSFKGINITINNKQPETIKYDNPEDDPNQIMVNEMDPQIKAYFERTNGNINI